MDYKDWMTQIRETAQRKAKEDSVVRLVGRGARRARRNSRRKGGKGYTK